MLHLFDVHGNDLGILSARYYPVVFNPALQRSYAIREVTKANGEFSGFYLLGKLSYNGSFIGGEALMYVSPGCLGQAYLQLNAEPAYSRQIGQAYSSSSLESLAPLFAVDPSGASFGAARAFASGLGSEGACVSHDPPIEASASITVEPFDPATFGFPYPIEGPLRIGTAP